MCKLICRVILSLALACPSLMLGAGKAEHVVLIVWDGMRPDFITREHTPTLFRLARDGVLFQNHHAVYCSATEVNGTALATGVYPAHSGIIANREYRPALNPLSPLDTQSDDAIRKGDRSTGGHYLLRSTLAEILHAAGKTTVIAGTKQVALLHDRRERPDDPSAAVILFAGKTLPAAALSPIQKLLGQFPPDVERSSTKPNEPRDEWTTKALLGPLWTNGVPVFSLLWLSEPDFSQHAAGPGSTKALAAIESSDRKLARVLVELDQRGLRDKTDVFVVSDHGFSTMEKSVDVKEVLRKAGFPVHREFKSAPKPGDIMVTGQGGSVFFYVIDHHHETTRKLVDFLQQQDFAGALFTREPMDGAFRLDDAHINSLQAPDAVLSMRWSSAASATGAPGLQISDSGGKAAQGNHTSLSRFDMHNILVGAGPDLKPGFNDSLPTGNMDLAPTILWLLGLHPTEPMDGRILSEALTVDAPPAGEPTTRRDDVSREHPRVVWHQYLQISRVNDTIYLDEGNGYTTPK